MTNNDDGGWTVVKPRERKPKSQKPIAPEPEKKETDEWNSVTVIRGRGNRKNKIANKSVKKYAKPNSAPGQFNTRKLADATDVDTIEKVSLSVGKLMQQARNALDLTQDELAKKINGKAKVNLNDIKAFESGTAIKDNAKKMAIENALNIRLTGKQAGSPIRKI